MVSKAELDEYDMWDYGSIRILCRNFLAWYFI